MALDNLEDYIPLIREDMLDYSPNNYLLESEEFTDPNIVRALEKALSKFNRMTPVIGDFIVKDFPAPQILVDMAIINLLRAALLMRLRNTVVYSDAGLSIDDQNWQGYQNVLNNLVAVTYSEAKGIKASINMNKGFKCIPSVYSGI